MPRGPAQRWRPRSRKPPPPPKPRWHVKKVDFLQAALVEFGDREGRPLFAVEHLIEVGPRGGAGKGFGEVRPGFGPTAVHGSGAKGVYLDRAAAALAGWLCGTPALPCPWRRRKPPG